jgi:hypothetical protein
MKKLLSVSVAVLGILFQANGQVRQTQVDTIVTRVDSIQRYLQSDFPVPARVRLGETLAAVRDSLLRREKNINVYNCEESADGKQKAKLVLDDALDSFIYNTFDKVVIGNDELIKNGTALNISVSDKTSLSANYLFRVSRWFALSTGLNATVSNNEVMIHNDGVWQSGWGGSLKASILLGSNKGRFGGECEKFFMQRKVFINNELLKYQTNVNSLQAKINRLNSRIEADSASASTLSYETAVPLDLERARAERDSLSHLLVQLQRAQGYNADQYISNVFDPAIKKFEAANAPWTGYTIKWLDVEASANSVDKTLLYASGIVDQSKISKTDVFWKYKFGVSFNYAGVGAKYSYYINALFAYQNAYALEGKSPVDTFNYGSIKVVNEKGGGIYDVSLLPDYRKQSWVPSPSILANYFWGARKTIGAELFCETIFRGSLEGVEESRKTIVNARIGAVFNFSEVQKTTIPTIGLFLKLNEFGFSNDFGKRLGVGIRAGLAFDRFLKKKS